MQRIFVLADTHDRLPANVLALAEEADEVWHLGDVCHESILDELRGVCRRLVVVHGNCDFNAEWPLVVELKRGGQRIRLQHIPPPRPLPDVDILLHGHTHVPRNERIGGVWFLNPGCVTRPNRGSPASVAWLTIAPDQTISWKPVSIR